MSGESEGGEAAAPVERRQRRGRLGATLSICASGTPHDATAGCPGPSKHVATGFVGRLMVRGEMGEQAMPSRSAMESPISSSSKFAMLLARGYDQL